ncbi:MAG: RidA family protein [Pseudomonadota bacterium]
MSAVLERLSSIGLTLPDASTPGANYTPFIRDGSTVFITGQLSQWNGERRYIGKVGEDWSLEEGQAAAQLAALNVIAHLQNAAYGNLDRVEQTLRLAIYVNSSPDFYGQSQVANGASDLFMQAFGEAGKHTRMAIGVATLPYNVAVEVEGQFRVI